MSIDWCRVQTHGGVVDWMQSRGGENEKRLEINLEVIKEVNLDLNHDIIRVRIGVRD